MNLTIMPTEQFPSYLKFIHSSAKDNDVVEVGCHFENINDVQSLSDELIFDFEQKTKTCIVSPIPNKRILHGFVRVFDEKSCYEDIEVFINQDNGLWVYEGESVIRVVQGNCCSNNHVKTTYINGDASIRVTVGNWVNTIKAFTYSDNDIKIDVSKDGNDFLLSLTINSCELYDVPIYVCGYDKNGVLIAQILFYLTVLFEETDDEECFLSVTPSQIILTNEQYKDKNYDSLKFTYNAYSPKLANLSINNNDIAEIEANTPYANTVSILDYITDEEYDKIEIDKVIPLNWELSSGCSAKTNIIIQKYVNHTPHLYVTANNSNIKISNLSFEDIQTETIDENANTISLPYMDAYTLIVHSSKSWSLYSYDSSIISCHKLNDELTIQLVNYAQVQDLEIILKNSDNIFYTIKYSIADGLVRTDEYEMYWLETLNDETLKGLEYNYGSYYRTISGETNIGITLHSAYSLVIDDNEPQYGDWSCVSSRNITYDVKQYRNSEWVSINSMKVGTKDISSEVSDILSDIFNINIFVGAEPITPKESDVWITTSQTFSTSTECYIDFVQVQGEASVRLNITHPPVVKYHVYTDQDGKVKINF